MSITIVSSAEHEFSQEERDALFEIMRDAYARTEYEIWGENYLRIPKHEFEELIDQGNIFGAKLDGQVVGTLFLKKMNPEESSFGLLGVHSSAEGRGVGSKLIEAAENHALVQGSGYMVLDILRPRDFELSLKKRLRKWYEGMGYVFTHHQNFEDRRPDRAKDLKVPSVFDCYRKELKK
ncbi:MAG: GNAT family N-acetyltransferase [Crocinitomicaceae bacterium]